MTFTFDRQPEAASGDFFTIGDHVEHRLIYVGKERQEEVETSFGKKDAILSDVYCVDCGTEDTDVLVFQGKIIAVLKNRLGEPVLGILGQEQTRPGMNPAWVLKPFAEEDATEAAEFWAALQGGGDPDPEPEPAPRRGIVRKAADTGTTGGKGRDISALRAAASPKF